jgi:hypothetical protein
VRTELPKVGSIRHEDDPVPEPEGFLAQIPAVVSVIPKDGQKVKPTGMSKLDIAWENGILMDTKGHLKCSVCDLTVDGLRITGFDSIPTWGIMIAPGMEVPRTEKVVHGKLVIDIPMTDIYDFRSMDAKGPARFVLSTYSHYVVMQPVGFKSMPQARKNAKLVKACQEHYEFLNMHSASGPKFEADYSTAFSQRLVKNFEKLERTDVLWRRPGFLVPFCPWHRRTASFNPYTRGFGCSKCGRAVGEAGEPPVVEEEDED